ncbi:hypothetical protein DOTSEDRAFT_80097 [Dothistroma septosporum NZE10]|uniref:Uncharacterized protein n=1 Tax=Dothistroma septosporum (strain NZE10 / CBS 128990) TaxID=675120 RepID=N1PPF3_DOTSN|nr:hypothetical protein DOTSEDRAFT_80097 [Dothistroma septosporum NZE10]
MARLRNVPATQVTATMPATRTTRGRPALREKTNTTRSSAAPVYENDGNTEDLIRDAKSKRGRAKKTQQLSDELLMTSGLGFKDGVVANQDSDSEAPMTTDELAKSGGLPVAVVKPSKRPARPGRKVLHDEQQSKVLEGLKQRMEATAKGQRARPASRAVVETAAASSATITMAQKSSDTPTEPTVERSDFSLSPSPPPPSSGQLSSTRRPSVVQPGSALRLQNTPAVEASMLALKNFKRRPRQPSMLQMVQQRTASARPSIANTAAAAETALEGTSAFDLDISDEEDDFAPEAEGTPLKVTKAQRRSSAKTQLTDADNEYKSKPSAKKRKTTDGDPPALSLSSSRPKRRKSTHVEEEAGEALPVANMEATAPPSSSARATTPLQAETSDVQVINSPSTSTPPMDPSSTRHQSPAKEDDLAIPSTEREDPLVRSSPTPELEDDLDDAIPNGTLAEPLSSSPAPQDPKVKDSFAEPATQMSPPAKAQPKKKVKHLTTSVLQSLLPKKRAPMRPRNRKTEYDLEDFDEEGSQLDVSHLEDDEDELGGAMRRKKATPLKNTKKRRHAKGNTVRGASKPPARNATAASRSKKTARTYGWATASDKENEAYDSAAEEAEDSTLPEVSTSMQDASLSKELKDAKKKFAEVDEFDMEFESMSHEDHRSSSQGWR